MKVPALFLTTILLAFAIIESIPSKLNIAGILDIYELLSLLNLVKISLYIKI